MRAATSRGPGDVRLVDVPWPEPGPGEFVLRVEAALVQGEAAAPNGCVGRVEALGDGVDSVQAGARVLPASSAACGHCSLCERGLTAQCEELVRRPGGCAEAIVVPARIVEGNVHAVPDGMPAAAAVLAEALACVLKARDRLPTRAGERVAVLGAGALGVLWTRVLSLTGAQVVDDDAETVVVAAGDAALAEAALRVVAPGGRVLVAAAPAAPATLPLDVARLHAEELNVLGSAHHTPYHLAEAIRALAAGLLDPDDVLQARVTLDELPAYAREHAADDPPPTIAVTA